MDDAIEFRHVSKSFPGVRALKDVSFSVRKGEVHALLGENGAGKSTLLNILHGVYPEYQGEVFLDGKKAAFKNPNDAIIKGKISKVHQEINIVRDLTVGQNITLGYEMSRGPFVDYKRLNERVDELLKKLNCDFSSEDSADTLTAGQMQMLDVAKALFHNSRVISFDEPTASLTDKETDVLFGIIGELKSSGITVIYVSHRLEEIFKICDRATILRDGEYITTLDVRATTREDLIHHMVGRCIDSIVSRQFPCCRTEESVLKVEGLSRKGAFRNLGFELKKGEILGFFGLVGAGRTEAMRVIFGADRKTSGQIYLEGKAVHIRNTRDALKHGIGLLPEERKTQGFINFTSNADNVAISCLERFSTYGFVDRRKKLANYGGYVDRLNINPKHPDFITQNMSGGNQQKVILAKWMSTMVDILIFDEPTKGIDVGAKMEIYRLMEDIVRSGKSIIVVSSELTEIIGISDRIIVMYEGRKTLELDRDEFDDKVILNHAMGVNAR
jgi:ribose transport system ATP-binding protein